MESSFTSFGEQILFDSKKQFVKLNAAFVVAGQVAYDVQ
jgi:hypothetical protein